MTFSKRLFRFCPNHSQGGSIRKLLSVAFLFGACAFPQTSVNHYAGSPRIYIPQQDGFESYISAAIVKKHVPAVVTENQDQAEYILKSSVQSKEESTGSKIAECLFLYCAGAAGTQTASVQLIDPSTQDVVWAYNVRKASAKAYQSTAEAIAKHLKHFLEEHPR